MLANVDIHLDWVRWSTSYDENRDLDGNLRTARPEREIFNFTGETINIGQGYDNGRKLIAGSIFWHSTRPEQGISVQMTGMDLQTMRVRSMLDEQMLLEFIEQRGGSVTTIHSCINVKNAGARPVDVLESHRKGLLKTRAKQVGFYSSQKKVGKQWQQGDTIYVGSPKSGIQLRVYDKAVELGITGDWTRIEIVFHGRWAQAAFKSMLLHGIPDTTRGAVLKYASFPSRWWDFAMQGDISTPEAVARKVSGRTTWLLNCVLPALQSEIDEQRRHGTDSIYETFRALIERNSPN